ncbi:MAG TPA: Uma2 family endonuclease [Candidatus Baltobacteraceae bacterium]|jgi:Uma2 family endonuclease|nr:Uma2 family endonuclease [Candidatus Baltobacteraceae bacterium]
MQREMTLPKAEPSLKWILGKTGSKASPQQHRDVVLECFFGLLDDWAQCEGEVGTERQFHCEPQEEDLRRPVPDVAYFSYERKHDSSDEDLEARYAFPTVAVEILSPTKKKKLVVERTRVYLAAGTDLVIVVDPSTRTIQTQDKRAAKIYELGETLMHPALPGFELDIAALFSALRRPERRDPAGSAKKKVDKTSTPDSHRHL